MNYWKGDFTFLASKKVSLHYSCSYVKCAVLSKLSCLQKLKRYADLKLLLQQSEMFPEIL